MSPFTRIYNRVALRVPGAPRPLINDSIRDAAIEFCKRTRLWRMDTTIVTTGNNVELFGDINTDVLEITSAKFDGVTIDPVSINYLDDEIPDWRNLTQSPRYMTQLEPNTLRLVPLATTSGNLALSLYACPSQAATTLPDWMVEKYHKIIASGAIADLAALPAQEFTDANIAMLHDGKFEEGIMDLVIQPLKGQQRAKPKTKTQWF